MNRPSYKGNAPLIVGEGTLVNKRDMIRALETLECVTYYDIVDKKIVSKGDGVVIKVFASKDSSTLIINGSIFVNVLSFDHLHFYPGDDGESIVDLILNSRMLRLVPREENPKLMSRINQNAFAYEEEGAEGEDAVAQQLLDDLSDLDDEDSK